MVYSWSWRYYNNRRCLSGLPGSSLHHHIEWRQHFIITMTPACLRNFRVGRLADWMVKDTKLAMSWDPTTLLKTCWRLVLLATRKRGASLQRHQQLYKKMRAKLAFVKLEDEVVKQYEKILAQVRLFHYNLNEFKWRLISCWLWLDNYSGAEIGELCRKYDWRNPDTIMGLENLNYSTSCLRAASAKNWLTS